MRKYSQRFGGTVLSELNVTPLIDLAFTLMIIFMITAPLIEQSMQLDLPQSKTNSTPPDPDAIAQVEVSASGEIRLNGQPVSLAVLEASLVEAVRQRPETVVALRADASLRYQQIVAIFDAVKASGARLGLATQKSEQP